MTIPLVIREMNYRQLIEEAVTQLNGEQITKQQLADRLGCSRKTLQKHLARMEADGLIDRGYRTVTPRSKGIGS